MNEEDQALLWVAERAGDGNIRVWDAASEQALYSLGRELDCVDSLEISPSERDYRGHMYHLLFD